MLGYQTLVIAAHHIGLLQFIVIFSWSNSIRTLKYTTNAKYAILGLEFSVHVGQEF